MELTESHTLPVPQQRAWEALNDTAILKACIPGCESIEADGENAYAVALTAAVGPVKARFKGRMQLADIDAPHSYTIVFEGQGGAAGFGKGDAHVKLEPEGDEATILTYTANASVGGKLAQIGSRLVDGAARKIAAEFFKRFGEQLGGGEAQENASAEPATQAEGEGEGAEDQPKRKRSWTAWISKS
jgi:carbon monoxide dehydrogenase subunit G